MKAVNLIPADSATGHSRSPVGVYVLLGVLALLVVMSATYTLVGRSVDSKRGELAAVTAGAQSAEAKAARLKPYTEFSTLRTSREETVKKLVDSRFDWAQALQSVARTLPSGTWVTSMRATVDPSAAVDGTTDQLRAAIPAPAIELAGCAGSQKGVARTVSSLRGISGVQRVTLSSSQEQADTDTANSSASDSAGATTGCGAHPQFSLSIFFAKSAGAASSSSPSPSSTATASATPGATTP
jgi:Tfp pilus assembly protein PilN